jgi:uncharacterized membrane protein YsdA (DUF1294 family)
MLFTAKLVVVYFLAINAFTFAAFYFDKKASMANRRRISEKTLLTLSLMGGSPFAMVAMKRFRHKTIKQPFKNILIGILVLQVILIIGMLYWLSDRLLTLPV